MLLLSRRRRQRSRWSQHRAAIKYSTARREPLTHTGGQELWHTTSYSTNSIVAVWAHFHKAIPIAVSRGASIGSTMVYFSTHCVRACMHACMLSPCLLSAMNTHRLCMHAPELKATLGSCQVLKTILVVEPKRPEQRSWQATDVW